MRKQTILTLAILLAAASQTFSVPGLRIAVDCSDIVLSWPSTTGQTFLVEFRSTLDSATTWTELTNHYPASIGTNTTFIHPERVPCSTSSFAGGGGESSGGTASPTVASDSSYEVLVMPNSKSSVPVPLNLYPPGMDLSGYILIWPDGLIEEWSKEFAEKYAIAQLEGRGEPQTENGGGESSVDSGFYRVIDVTPIARRDIAGVEQDSGGNQINVLANDSDPNDDRFLIAGVTAAGHGEIVYTPDGATFQYTPASGFYGQDSFAYSITNFHGGRATATVTVFVNQTGNQPPSANDLFVTLQTNIYTTAFNALTNAFDGDSDPLSLFAVTAPRLGTLTTNSTADIIYERNPDWFGRDSFQYFVTDGRGGYAAGSLVIVQQDDDTDGMADEWELRYGLDLSNDDSTLDPDGDGLPNLAEYKLQRSPNVSDNPLNLATIVNGSQVSGFTQLPLAGFSPDIERQPITLYLNGSPAANAFLSQKANGQWGINWHTDFLTNGNYSIQAAFHYKPYAPLTETNLIFGELTSVQVTNLVMFDAFTSKFTDFLLIDAKLAMQNATYRVDLYDEDDTPLVYGVFETTNGLIQLYWDLTDGQGNQIAFGNIRAKFTFDDPVQMNSSSLDPVFHWFTKDTSTSGNGFVVAWGWDIYSTTFNNRRTQLMLGGVINILGNPSEPDSYNLAPAANVPYANTFRYDSESDKKTLLAAVADPGNGNFFWFGHGSAAGISGNEERSLIVAADVQQALKNFAALSTPQRPRTNMHPYRLVILNGCETYSPEWADAFGIDFDPDGGRLDVWYNWAGRPKRAFVGWKEQIDVPGYRWYSLNDKHPQYAEALGLLFFNWMQGYFLNYSVNQFADRATFYGFSNADSAKISGCINMTRW